MEASRAHLNFKKLLHTKYCSFVTF